MFLCRDQLVPLSQRLPVLILQLPQLLLEHIRIRVLCINSSPHVLHLRLHLTHLLLREPSILLRHSALVCHSLRLVLRLRHLSASDLVRICQLLHQLLDLSLQLGLLLALPDRDIPHLLLAPAHGLILEHLNLRLVALETSHLLLQLLNNQVLLSQSLSE
jgi:hypothetical protein